MKSLALPFNVVGGRIATTSDIGVIVDQKIVDVLVTGKFERPALPDYGAAIRQLLFENIDKLVEADFKADAAMELVSNISGITLIDLVIEQDEVSTTATITVLYRTTLSPVRTLTFQLAAGLLTEESPI